MILALTISNGFFGGILLCRLADQSPKNKFNADPKTYLGIIPLP